MTSTPAPAAPQNPADTPATLLELVIRIPVRRFPPANAEEKALAVSVTRNYLDLVDSTSSIPLRMHYCAQLFYELARQPILVAQNPKFREVTVAKIAEMEDDLRKYSWNEHTDSLEDALHEVHMMLADLPHHPWYTA